MFTMIPIHIASAAIVIITCRFIWPIFSRNQLIRPTIAKEANDAIHNLQRQFKIISSGHPEYYHLNTVFNGVIQDYFTNSIVNEQDMVNEQKSDHIFNHENYPAYLQPFTCTFHSDTFNSERSNITGMDKLITDQKTTHLSQQTTIQQIRNIPKIDHSNDLKNKLIEKCKINNEIIWFDPEIYAWIVKIKKKSEKIIYIFDAILVGVYTAGRCTFQFYRNQQQKKNRKNRKVFSLIKLD